MAFDVFITWKAVTAAAWPGPTCVVVVPTSATAKLTLPSTLKVSDAVCCVWATPPTWKFMVTVLVICNPAEVCVWATAGVAPSAASVMKLAAPSRELVRFMD